MIMIVKKEKRINIKYKLDMTVNLNRFKIKLTTKVY